MAYTAKEIERLEEEEQRKNAAVILQTLPRLLHFWISPGSTGKYSATNVNDEVIRYDYFEEKAGITTFGDVIYLGVSRVRGHVLGPPLPAYYRSMEAWEIHSAAQKPTSPGLITPAKQHTENAATPLPSPMMRENPYTVIPLAEAIMNVREASLRAKPAQLDSPINDILAKKDAVIERQGKTIEVLKEAVDDLKGKITRPAGHPSTSEVLLSVGYGNIAAVRASPPPPPKTLTIAQKTAVKMYLGALSSWCTTMGFTASDLPALRSHTLTAVLFRPVRSTEVPMPLWKVYVNFCKSNDFRATDEGLLLRYRGSNYPLPPFPDSIRSFYKDYVDESGEVDLYALGARLT